MFAAIMYSLARNRETVFIAMTSLRVSEFDELIVTFKGEFEEEFGKETFSPGRKGRPRILPEIHHHLFFILFYMKCYQIQEVVGFLFGLSQSRANQLIHELSPILNKTLIKLGHAPTRSSDILQEELSSGVNDLVIDGTERPVQRPQDDDVQKAYYSGKKKRHMAKNIIVCSLDDNKIKFLGETREGSMHDKKATDEEHIELSDNSTATADSGFQGCQLGDAKIIVPNKKPPGGQLTDSEKERNTLISSVRVVVEHIISGIKRLHIVKDVFRNTKDGFDDLVMEIACGLHNFRCECRKVAE
jgi:hypothetical protein